MNCSKCGIQNSIDAKNCINCGQPLVVNQPSVQPTTAPTQVQQPIAPVQPTVPVQQPTAPTPVQPTVAPEPATLTPVEPQVVAQLTAPTPIEANPTPPPEIGNNVSTELPQKGKKKIGKIPIIIVAILLVCGIVLVVILFLKGENVNAPVDKNDTTAFFLRDSDYNYILFNEDGEQLSEIKFEDIGDDFENFVNGAIKVTNTDDEVGIINDKGEMVVPFGKYTIINPVAGLYSVVEETETEEGKKYNKYLIDGTGKVLYDMNNKDLIQFITEGFTILDHKEEKKYTVLNYKGKELVSFQKIENEEYKDKPETSEEKNYISVFYNNQNWVFNIDTGKEIVTFKNENHFCVNHISEDEKIITLNSCGDSYYDQQNVEYKIIKDGKAYDKPSQCKRVYIDKNLLYCEEDSVEKYFLNDDLSVGIKRDYDGVYKNNKNYAITIKENNFPKGVEFYYNGELVKTVSEKSLTEYDEPNQSEIYILYDDGYQYYNNKGELLFDKTFKRAQYFDINNLAKVSEDSKNYYLIDTKGKQFGGTYTNISITSESLATVENPNRSKFYKVEKDELFGVINEKGEEILTPTYKSIYISTASKRTLASIEENENQYVVYDLDKNKELFSLETYPEINQHYIKTTSKDNKTQYYTYDGKLFFEK